MATWVRTSIVALSFLGGGGGVQVGLANAQVLGGDTPETRVHDVVANGHDACERSGFPPGQVLDGQPRPCSVAGRVAVVAARARSARPTLTRWHGLGVCVAPGFGFARAEMKPAGASVSSSGQFACARPW